MLNLKAFALNSSFVDNGSDVVPSLGVLSAHSLTYTRDRGFYKNSEISQAIGIRAFTTIRDGVDGKLTAAESDAVITVAKTTYDFGVASTGTQLTPEQFRVHLVTQHNTIIGDVFVGPTTSEDGVWAPTFITFTLRGTADSSISIWFSDESFQTRFPDTELFPIMPIDRLDDFFDKPGAEIEAMIKLVDPEVMVSRMQVVRGKYPESYKRVDMFTYYDPVQSGRMVPTPFGMLVYGIAGNNIDSIKEKLQEYIIANSTHTREEWAVIFPEIFRKNEVIIVPLWDQIAIPNKSNTPGEFSPQCGLKELYATITKWAVGYPAAHITEHTGTTGFPYRSIALVSIGHPENTDGLFSLRALYPDWINTNTTQDFNRMQPATREWALAAMEAVQLAETFTDTDVVPENFMKVKRGDALFLTFTKRKVNYLVLCKVSVAD